MSGSGALSSPVALGVLTLSLAGQAAPPSEGRPPEVSARAVLEWRDSEATAGCIKAEALTQAVETRLGRQVFVPEADADLSVTVSLAREDSGAWSSDIDLGTMEGRHLGHRKLTTHARHCSALDESLTLVIALMVDVSREDVRIETQRPPLSPSTPLSLPPVTTAPREPWEAVISVRGVGTLGQMPGIGRGVRLASEIRPPGAFAIELGVTAWADQEVHLASGGATFSLFTAELALCGLAVRSEATDLLLCVGQQVGFQRATAQGFSLNRDERVTLYDLFGKIRSAWWILPPFGLTLGVGFSVPVMRDEYFALRADGTRQQLFKPAPVAALAEAGVGLRW